MNISEILFGSKDKFRQASTQTPEQQQGLSQILQLLSGMGSQGGGYNQAQDYISRILGGDQQSYDRFSQPYLNQFQEQIIPGIAERFAGLGGGMGGGSLGSSGFAQALGGAGSQLQSNLAGLYSQLQQQAAQQAFGQYNNLANLGLGTRSFENLYQPGSTGLVGGVLSGAAKGVGKAVGLSSGNGISGMISNWFSRNQPQQTSSMAQAAPIV